MNKPIFKVADLPQGCQRNVASALRNDKPGEALDQLEDYLFAGGERTNPVLLAQAFCEVEFACTVMVDEVLARTTKALALLDEVIALGADERAIKGFRSRCKRLNDQAKELEQETGKLSAVDSAKLDNNQLRDLAHQLTDKGGAENNAKAAELWCLAYQRARESWERHDRYVRMGLCLAEARKWEEAIPVLEAIVKTKPSQPGHDSWMTEFAFGHLLDHAAQGKNKKRYLAIWQRAIRWAERDGDGYFPVPRPSQDEALAVCVEWKLRQQCEYLLGVYQEHRPPRTITPAVRKLMEKAQRLLGG